jgi:hypothetical protein
MHTQLGGKIKSCMSTGQMIDDTKSDRIIWPRLARMVPTQRTIQSFTDHGTCRRKYKLSKLSSLEELVAELSYIVKITPSIVKITPSVLATASLSVEAITLLSTRHVQSAELADLHGNFLS